MRDHRDAAFVAHPLDRRAPSTRHNDVDIVVEPQQFADSGAVAGRNQLDGSFGKTRFGKSLCQERVNRPR